MNKRKIWPYAVIFLSFFNALLIGSMLGLALSATKNIENIENFTEFETALPTRITDINGELITEFSSDEKREIIALDDLPQLMKDALITREDHIFYEHPGFSTKALFRAVFGVLTRSSLGGGSTLTQQIAGTLYCDRTEISAKRKLKELWWAIQMERRFSKNEIMELYMNKIYFGGGTYGVNAACKYYFGHGPMEITPAEAAILVIQLSNPVYYNPFEHPNRAQQRQISVLNAMVEEGYITKQESEDSFEEYWGSFDYTRTSTSAYDMRTDEAPWFSEYVRRELSGMLYGSNDLYSGGFVVNTTLNLSHQREAEKIMHEYINYANDRYRDSMAVKDRDAFKKYTPFSELCMLVFNLPDLHVNDQRAKNTVIKKYRTDINPIIDLVALMNGMESLKTNIVTKGNALIRENDEKTTIEGTMISVQNSTGYINALVGGSKYDQQNQFIRAVQAKLQPGSTIKPLYYSAAIDSRQYTWSTIVSDTPVVFHKEDGSPYIPQDFKGVWEGDVEIWYALAHSMNVPSLKVLDSIGFSAAISRTSALYGIPQKELDERNFEPVYPFGLGVCSVRPIEVAKAFSTIANNGYEVVPIAIRTVEDQNGNIILNPEKDAKIALKAKGSAAQVISHQTAFIMQEMLKQTVDSGTLRFGSDWESTAYCLNERRGKGNKFRFTDSQTGQTFLMPAAGKTGTTQNWADAWTVGFTPYYTSVFWFGFDRPGQSLGLRLTGSTLAGVAWGDFMNYIHEGLRWKAFNNDIPEGVVKYDVCTKSGGLITPECGDHKITAYYLAGTEPGELCTYHTNNTANMIGITRLQIEGMQAGYQFQFEAGEELGYDIDFLNYDLTSAERASSYEGDLSEESEDADLMYNWLLQ
ncbi:PBP1A family penicillin-binding protein [Treponema rectale]|uniref:peptidoglycan glycosyltransferase n=1 Tax=Treponema rectale TaxID=744512 RepID=A0A840SEU0_9SPIR|nr:PBP1A family penicillin-binding protein [Treponema rectale]MBB5218073.1 penicillin-binding protein 1A [Treponema rectale]QOS40213.1 PBP1A family penicillin-binding protein [Treponema rectale]